MKAPKKVVVVGAGFGGLQAVKKLSRNKSLRITLIDRTNHHLFAPLLYQVATATLSPADIAIPARNLTRKKRNVTVFMDNVISVDKEKKLVICEEKTVPYDYLILAMGSKTGYFGKNDWEKYTLGLKDLSDALKIRKKILTSFEEAEKNPNKSRELLNYVIIGGGPTGVELAGSIAELSRHIFRNEFRNIDTANCKVTLIEAGPRLLAAFDEKLSEYTRKSLEERGVNVILNTKVENIEENKVYIPQGVLHTDLIIWAAGVEPVPITKTLGVPLDRQNRVIVNEYCTPENYPDIYVIGDMAHFEENGKPLPGISPVAMQQGRYAAKCIINSIKGIKNSPFKYTDKGIMATIGRKDAIAEKDPLKMKGFIGWLAWLFVHLWYQVGFKNKISILVTWIWSYLTFGASARLIQSPIDSKNPEDD